MNQKRIGIFIAECRKEKKLTQEQLADKLGVTNRSVSRWENGKNMPDYSILKELCSILGIDINEFLSGEHIVKEDIESYSIDNLDLVLKEYYNLKKQKKTIKTILISISIMFICFMFKSFTFCRDFFTFLLTPTDSDYISKIDEYNDC